MGSAAFVVLVLLAIVLAIQLARGTLGQWLAAKFLNRAPATGIGGSGVAGAGGAGAAGVPQGPGGPGTAIGPGTLGGGIGGPTQVWPGGNPPWQAA